MSQNVVKTVAAVAKIFYCSVSCERRVGDIIENRLKLKVNECSGGGRIPFAKLLIHKI